MVAASRVYRVVVIAVGWPPRADKEDDDCGWDGRPWPTRTAMIAVEWTPNRKDYTQYSRRDACSVPTQT